MQLQTVFAKEKGWSRPKEKLWQYLWKIIKTIAGRMAISKNLWH